MHIGDLVALRGNIEWLPNISAQSTGVIIDAIHMDDGFVEFEVMFDDGSISWCSDIMLQRVNPML